MKRSHISAPAPKLKRKTLCLLQLSNFRKTKCLYILIHTSELKYGHIVILEVVPCQRRSDKILKWPHLSPEPKIRKLKVLWKQRAFIFWFCLRGWDTATLISYPSKIDKEQPRERQFGQISVPRPRMKQLMALCFLELLKVKKVKWPSDWDMATFSKCLLKNYRTTPTTSYVSLQHRHRAIPYILPQSMAEQSRVE